jgi:hypothetical protein
MKSGSRFAPEQSLAFYPVPQPRGQKVGWSLFQHPVGPFKDVTAKEAAEFARKCNRISIELITERSL